MKTHKFARKTFYVDAVRLSEANIDEVAEWCKGKIETDAEGHTFLKVEVYRPLNERQEQAYIGDWILYANSGFKVYTPKAFDKAFEKVRTLTKEQADAAGITPPIENPPKDKPAGKRGPSPKDIGRRGPKKPPRVGHVGQALKDAEAKAQAIADKNTVVTDERGTAVNQPLAEPPEMTVEEIHGPIEEMTKVSTGKLIDDEGQVTPAVVETISEEERKQREADALIQEVTGDLEHDRPLGTPES